VFPVLIVPPSRPVEAVIVSHSWMGVVCHWWKAPGEPEPRTRLCTAPDQCPCLSEADVPVTWHCYLLVVTLNNLRPGVLCLTDNGLSSLVSLCPEEVSFRGQVIVFKRSSAHKSSKVVAERSPKDWKRPLMERLSIRPTLEVIHGKKPVELWAKSHPEEDFLP